MDLKTKSSLELVARMIATNKYNTNSGNPVDFNSFWDFFNDDQKEMLENLFAFDQNNMILDFIEQFNSLAKYGYMKKAIPLAKGLFCEENYNAKLSDKHQFHVDIDGMPRNEINFVERKDNELTTLKIKGSTLKFMHKTLDDSFNYNFYETYTYNFSIVNNSLIEKTYSDSYEEGIEFTLFSKDLQK